MKKMRQLFQSASTSFNRKKTPHLLKFLDSPWAVEKANKKLVLLNQLVKRERKGLPQGQSSWQKGCLFVWGGEGEKKRVGKSSPPGAVNTHTITSVFQTTASKNRQQKKTRNTTEAHWRRSCRGVKVSAFVGRTLQANPKYPSA